MKVIPITNNDRTFKGHLNQQTGNLILGASSHFSNNIVKTSKGLENFSLAMRMSFIYSNLLPIMERFAHSAELSFVKLKNSSIHRFFIEDRGSNYKYIASDISLSEKCNQTNDVDALETLVSDLAKVNPFEVNSKFKLQRKPNTFDYSFEPDKSYVDIENRLIIPDKKAMKEKSAGELMTYFDNLSKDSNIYIDN